MYPTTCIFPSLEHEEVLLGNVFQMPKAMLHNVVDADIFVV